MANRKVEKTYVLSLIKTCDICFSKITVDVTIKQFGIGHSKLWECPMCGADHKEGAGHAKGKNKRPLKKIVERYVKGADGVFRSKLECGHFVAPSRDFYGEVHAQKQRCPECYRASRRNHKGEGEG